MLRCQAIKSKSAIWGAVDRITIRTWKNVIKIVDIVIRVHHWLFFLLSLFLPFLVPRITCTQQLKFVFMYRPGLPDFIFDSIFAYQNYQFLVYLARPWNINSGTFYGSLLHCMDILYSLWPFGIFVQFWYIVPRKIWQPCNAEADVSLLYMFHNINLRLFQVFSDHLISVQNMTNFRRCWF
jgi:hypothetical protein